MKGRERKRDWVEKEVEQPWLLYEASAKLVGNSGANITHQLSCVGQKYPCFVQSLDMSCLGKSACPAPEVDPDVTESWSYMLIPLSIAGQVLHRRRIWGTGAEGAPLYQA